MESGRGAITIGENGIDMKWDKITNWEISFEVKYGLFWPVEYGFNVDLVAKDIIIDNGLYLKGDSHSGKPVFSFFNTDVDLA